MNKFTRVVRPAPKPQTPVEALLLAEDMERIKMVVERLQLIDPLSISKSREEGEMQIRLWIVSLRRALDYAQQRMRRDFLSEEPPIPRVRWSKGRERKW